MRPAWAFWLGEEPSGTPSGDPEEILSSEESEDAETSPPSGDTIPTKNGRELVEI